MLSIDQSTDFSLSYTAPENVTPEIVAGRPVLSTPQNGRVVVDASMLDLWRIAQGHDLAEITRTFHKRGSSPAAIAAGLSCLVEAGLLLRDRQMDAPNASPHLETDVQKGVSAIIVAYNGLKWLPGCLNSLLSQTYPCLEIIVVDNASSDDTANWIRNHYSEVRVIETGGPLAFARALNFGIAATKGDFLLPLNQDTVLDVNAVANLVDAARSPDIAAVVPCLRLMRAPAFINGIGNQARVIGWGTDNYIGYLDLDQFDLQFEVPSVCLAAALISRRAWETVGSFDEGFPMYYEDIEWSYRARLKGFRLVAAPQALVYHDFGGGQRFPTEELNLSKLRNVIYGRLRFATKLINGWRKSVYLLVFVFQDTMAILAAGLTMKFKIINAYWLGWTDWLRQPPQPLRFERIKQGDIFSPWEAISAPRIWHGMPELTWESIGSYYLPLISHGKVRHLPELDEIRQADFSTSQSGWGRRLSILWQDGGLKGILRVFWRRIRWWLG